MKNKKILSNKGNNNLLSNKGSNKNNNTKISNLVIMNSPNLQKAYLKDNIINTSKSYISYNINYTDFI